MSDAAAMPREPHIPLQRVRTVPENPAVNPADGACAPLNPIAPANKGG
jgi:hypothetical protein